MIEVEHIIDSTPENGQYEALKVALIKRLSDSSSMRVRKLLEGEEIGDRTPSQFLRHLRNLAGTSVNEEFLLILWTARLSTSTQHGLVGLPEKSLNALAEIAERVHEIRPEKGRIAVVSQDSAITALKKELMQLIKLEVTAINRGHGRRERWQSRFRTRSTSRRSLQNRATATTSENCWYHEKF